jgi:hypothetical protein
MNRWLSIATWGFAVACAAPADLDHSTVEGVATAPLPPAPLIDVLPVLARTASTAVDASTWAQPHPPTGFGFLPPGHHTRDLRIRTENCDQAGGTSRPGLQDTSVCIFATTPEAFAQPVAHEAIAAMTQPVSIDPTLLHGVPEIAACPGCVDLSRGQRLICDAPTAGENPYACTAAGVASTAGDHDCYDVWHVAVLHHGQWDAVAKKEVGEQRRLVATRLKVIVAAPKTAIAHVEQVDIGEIKNGPEAAPGNALFTPAVSGDGQLLLVETGHGIAYAYSPTPCDVTQWTTFAPITAMHDDPALRARYGLARFPIRDPENQLPDHLGSGGYLWLDGDATLLMFNYARGNAPFYWDGQVRARYTVDAFADPTGKHPPPTPAAVLACGADAACFAAAMRALGDTYQHHAMGVVGLWTHGKVVVPDTQLHKNALALAPGLTAEVELYRDDHGAPIRAHLTSNDIRRKAGFQNAFNANPNLRPDDPRDVVWQIGTNLDTDELAFDDFVTTAALIVSPMNASVTEVAGVNRLHDGYGATDAAWGATGAEVPRVQNTATALAEGQRATAAPEIAAGFASWNVPAAGLLRGGGRIEPLASGGVRGAGLYLGGASYVEYTVPLAQPAAMASAPWFYDVWLDPRASAAAQVVLAVAGASQVSQLSLAAGGGALVITVGTAQVTLPLDAHLAFAARRWAHLALAAEPAAGATLVTAWVNGLAVGRATLPIAGAFAPAPGKPIALGGGDGDTHFVGWVDELRVLSRVPGPEELCRHAHGTLVGLAPGDPGFLYAASYPATTHQAISAALGAAARAAYGVSAYPRYLCEMAVPQTAQPPTHHCIDDVRRPARQPDPRRCVGMAIVFPEGPIRVGVKRPDATGNAFCRSCHVDGHPSPSLTVGHLAPSVAPAGAAAAVLDADGAHYLSEFDPRRQPMQPPAWTRGYQPAGLFCAGVPAIAQTTGVLTDRWVARCP